MEEAMWTGKKSRVQFWAICIRRCCSLLR